MKIRIVSDLHLDVNVNYPLELKDKKMFTLIAGDTSGYPDLSILWIRANLKGGGIVIAGNHICYNRYGRTIHDLKLELARAFPPKGKITFLDNEFGTISKEIAEDLTVIGTTLYSDYRYAGFCGYSKEENMMIASRIMNDFRHGIYEKNGNAMIRLRPDHYVEWFNASLLAMNEKLDEIENSQPEKSVIVMTHHCPSPLCRSDRYGDSDVDASYISDLEWFIEKHKSIRAWVCGHIHETKVWDYEREDGSTCKIIMNPRGYCWSGENTNWSPSLYLDTDTWTIHKE